MRSHTIARCVQSKPCQYECTARFSRPALGSRRRPSRNADLAVSTDAGKSLRLIETGDWMASMTLSSTCHAQDDFALAALRFDAVHGPVGDSTAQTRQLKWLRKNLEQTNKKKKKSFSNRVCRRFNRVKDTFEMSARKDCQKPLVKNLERHHTRLVLVFALKQLVRHFSIEHWNVHRFSQLCHDRIEFGCID